MGNEIFGGMRGNVFEKKVACSCVWGGRYDRTWRVCAGWKGKMTMEKRTLLI